MKTIALNRMEYLKIHSSDEGMLVTTLAKKTGRILEQMTTGVFILAVATVVTLACMKVGKPGITSAHYCDAITQVVFTP